MFMKLTQTYGNTMLISEHSHYSTS